MSGLALVIQAALSRASSRLQFREERLRGRLLFSVLSLFKPGSAPLRNALQVVACCLDVPLFSSRRRESASGHTLSPLGRGRTRGEARARPRAHDPCTWVKISNTTMKSEKCRPNQARMGDRLTNCACVVSRAHDTSCERGAAAAPLVFRVAS